MKIYTAFTHDELQRLQYPVLLDLWDKFKDGQRRRKYLAKFNESERALLSKYYNIFYKWYFSTGTPQEHFMKITTYEFLNKAIYWFVQNDCRSY